MIHTFIDRTNAGWLDSNCLRDYPLVDGSSIPRALIADAFIVACSPSGSVSIQSITVSEAIVSIWFVSSYDSSIQGVVSASLSRSSPTPVNIQSPNGSMHGSVVFGDPSAAKELGRGNKVFVNPIYLVTRAYINAGYNLVQSITVPTRIGTLTGRVKVESAFPMYALADKDVNEPAHSLVLTLAGNDHLMLADCQNAHQIGDCGCEDAIATINGVEPDPDTGDILLVVESDPSGIVDIALIEGYPMVLIETSADRDEFCTRVPELPDKYGRIAGTDDQNPPTSDYLLRYPDDPVLDLPADSPSSTVYPECPTPPSNG